MRFEAFRTYSFYRQPTSFEVGKEGGESSPKIEIESTLVGEIIFREIVASNLTS